MNLKSTENRPLPRVLVDTLNHSYGARLDSQARFSDVPPVIAVSAGDLLTPLHILLADIACADMPGHCAKMRFAAAVVDKKTGEVVATGYNSPIRSSVLYGLPNNLYCNGTDCIRDQVKSRTEALVGECEHAFWVAALALKRQGIDLSYFSGDNPQLLFYEAGFSKPKDAEVAKKIPWLPWVASDPTYTCLYCDNLLLTNDIRSVWAMKKLPDQNAPRWTEIDIRRSIITDAKTAVTGYMTT